MKKYIFILIFSFASISCSDFLELAPEYLINESAFYRNATDFETALIGNYAGMQSLHNATVIYLGELTTDNATIQWTAPSISEMELDELNLTPVNSFANSLWNWCFTIISRSNNLITRLDEASIPDELKEQYSGESLFLRAFCYFYLVRAFGDVPIVTEAFRSPEEILSFDKSRKPKEEVYQVIIDDLQNAATRLEGITGLSKSRASTGAAKTLLGKVHLTQGDYSSAADVLKDVIDMNKYTLQPDYKTLFTNGNDELVESIFEIKYLSGNVGEGNNFSALFTPLRFDIAIFPGNMQGGGRIVPDFSMRDAYEAGDLRRAASIGDSVRLVDGTYDEDFIGLKFVDFTVGLVGDGGINFTALRYADVLLMYAEALSHTGDLDQAHFYLNQVRDRADLDPLTGLSESEFAMALENERRVEFFLEGHRWFDLARTGRAQEVMNAHFEEKNMNFSLEDHELLFPIPQGEIDIDPGLEQNPGY